MVYLLRGHGVYHVYEYYTTNIRDSTVRVAQYSEYLSFTKTFCTGRDDNNYYESTRFCVGTSSIIIFEKASLFDWKRVLNSRNKKKRTKNIATRWAPLRSYSN